MTAYIMLTLLISMLVFRFSNAQEYTVTGLFREDSPLSLTEPFKLSCRDDGDKIKISDILYKTSGCRNSATKPQDPATEQNKLYIDQCTGKRTCVVPPDLINRPFLPRKPANCLMTTKYQISVIYTCVPQELIKSMCSSFSVEEYMGYLSTPSYPMLLKPGEPVAACKCHLQGTGNSRISLKLLEYNLVGNTSGDDLLTCQSEESKQYLEIAYNRGHYYTHILCNHKYNLEVTPSSTYDLLFESPISREAGSLWIQYTAEEPNSMVSVSCVEPIVTTIAPIHYTKPLSEYGNGRIGLPSSEGINYRLILGIVAAVLFLLIIISVVVITVKYNRRISHYMMHKYSKRRQPKDREFSPPEHTVDHISTNINGYQETHFDSTDETISCGKPTAHIPPQLSINEKLNKVSEFDPKAKLLNGSAKYAIYLPKQQRESDSEVSDSSGSKHSIRSDRTHTSETSSASSIRRMAPSILRHQAEERAELSPGTETTGPKFEDIWVRVNTPEIPRRSVSMTGNHTESGYETDHLLRSRPPTDISFSSAGTRVQLPDVPSASTLPLLQRSANSRENSDEEEMDIKFLNPNSVSPFKTPIHVVKPALKSSVSALSSRSPSARRDSVKFSDVLERSASSAEYGYSGVDRRGKLKMKSAMLNSSPHIKSKSTPQPLRKSSSSNYNQQQLMVDLEGPSQRKSKSLPGYSRRLNSASSQGGITQNAKRPKRKCVSDNDHTSFSSQEQIYQPNLVPVPPIPAPPVLQRSKSKRVSSTAKLSQKMSDIQLSVGTS